MSPLLGYNGGREVISPSAVSYEWCVFVSTVHTSRNENEAIRKNWSITITTQSQYRLNFLEIASSLKFIQSVHCREQSSFVWRIDQVLMFTVIGHIRWRSAWTRLLPDWPVHLEYTWVVIVTDYMQIYRFIKKNRITLFVGRAQAYKTIPSGAFTPRIAW